MELKKCPNCGKNILAIAKVCKHCGESFEIQKNVQEEAQQSIVQAQAQTTPPVVEELDENSEQQDSNPILIILAWLCWILAGVDFCGMFFGYDMTGVSWSPIAIGGIGTLFNYLGNREIE
jgi:uncharacterized membrane protein YvbJ